MYSIQFGYCCYSVQKIHKENNTLEGKSLVLILFSTKKIFWKPCFLHGYGSISGIFVGFRKTSSNYQGYRPLMLYIPRMYSLICFAENTPGATIIYAFHQLDVLDLYNYWWFPSICCIFSAGLIEKFYAL